MNNSIRVFSPATIANVGPGFDLMGFALDGMGEEIVVTKNDLNELRIEPVSGFSNIPTDPKKNVATVAVSAMLSSFGIQQGFDFEFIKNIKPGSGLGTSASSSTGAVFAVNELLDRPCTNLELITYAMEGEKYPSNSAHADNIAPTLLGGFQLVRSYEPLDVISLQYPSDLLVSVVRPLVEIKTSDARKMLSSEVSMKQSITQCGNLAGLINGLASNDKALINRSMNDVIVEPVRAKLIPKYYEAKSAALEAGAIGCNIAGSGPSIFAFSNEKKIAKNISTVMKNLYQKDGIESVEYVTKIGNRGCVVI